MPDAWRFQVADQERVIGRTKLDSIELEDRSGSSHIARTDQERFGDIFRGNLPCGSVTDRGTMSVGFAADERPLVDLLESMTGRLSGERDALRALHRAPHRRVLLQALNESLLRVPKRRSYTRPGVAVSRDVPALRPESALSPVALPRRRRDTAVTAGR
jgi:Dyp-type peroxidase family protein